jgi:hypothetical protein
MGWGIFKNRHLSNATGRIRDESLMNLEGRGTQSFERLTRLVIIVFLTHVEPAIKINCVPSLPQVPSSS